MDIHEESFVLLRAGATEEQGAVTLVLLEVAGDELWQRVPGRPSLIRVEPEAVAHESEGRGDIHVSLG